MRVDGDNVKHERDLLGLTQGQLARKVGLKLWEVDAIEKGVMSAVPDSVLFDIADALGVRPHDLIAKEG